MFKPAALITFFLLCIVGQAQEVSLPADLRQHTLNHYNASLFNPAFSLDRNNPQSVAFWTRWQWQDVDADPTTLFLNYSRSLNENSAAGIGFFQHNTGIYFNTGGALNYAYQIEFNRLIKLSVGANVFGFVQQLADTRFPVSPIPGIPQSTPTDDFILQVAPGFNLQVENFSLSLASENLFDYNFTDKAGNTATSDKIFMGMASYDFPIMASDSTAYVRPSIYLRTIPEQENQIGLNALFSTQKYWIQSGYNNFYGISVGAGGTLFNRFSLGAMVEFGTSASLNSKDPSFEILASYYIGKPEQRRPVVASGIIDESLPIVTIEDEELSNQQMKEELEKAEKLANQEDGNTKKLDEEDEPVMVEEGIVDEEPTKEDKKEVRRLAAEQKAFKKQKRKDSIAAVKKEQDALALLKKQEDEQARNDAKEAKEAEEIETEKANEARLAEAEELKEQQQKEELQKAKDAEARSVEQKRKSDSTSAAKRAAAEVAELKLKTQQRKDSISDAKEAETRAAAEKLKELQRQESLENAKKLQATEAQRKRDSTAKAEKETAIAEALKAQEQNRIDSIAKVNMEKELAAKKLAEEAKQAEQEVVTPKAGEKYEEVTNEDGLEPGYYLIANVFGTKKYFDAFMGDLTNKGLQPKSFFRSSNKYNYAYLEKYDTIRAARQARDSKFDGKYAGKTWIFRVVGK